MLRLELMAGRKMAVCATILVDGDRAPGMPVPIDVMTEVEATLSSLKSE